MPHISFSLIVAINDWLWSFIKLALKKAEDADLNLLVFDQKSVDFASFLKDLNLEKCIFVINKSDLGNNENQNLHQYNPISISIKE